MASRQRLVAVPKVELIAPEMDLETEGETDTARMDRAGTILRQGIPAAASALSNKAADGGITHLKLMFDLVGIEKGAFASKEPRPREKTLHERLREEWDREP